jgi:exodeoxyribonuclease VII large subunit
MSEQLSLGGFSKSPSENKKSEKPKRVVTKTAAEIAIEERINALVEQKSKNNALIIQETIISQSISVESGTAAAHTSEISSIKNSDSFDEATGELDKGEKESEKKKEEPEVLTVSGLNKSIKTMLEKSYAFLWVKGEISNFKMPSSGHMYFTLKDSGAQVRAIMFRGFAQSLKFKPADGMEVLVRCKVTVYEPRGDYQLFCEVMEPVGYGALQVAFEQLKAKLESEGLFDLKRKKQIPGFPTKLCLITSPTGAAIRDMLNILSRRFGGGLDITIFPTSVQGDKAPGEIARALDLANKMGLDRFDVIILGRGGGSLEDLWAFNMEEVARAVARSLIPTISAVGHEVDFTICDFVADLRAPTPSAAAELVVKNKADLVDRINSLQRHITQQALRKIQLARAKLQGSSKRLIDPKRKLQDLMLRTDEWSDRLIQTMQRYLSDLGTEVRFLKEKLGSPERQLKITGQKISNLENRLRLLLQASLQRKQSLFARLGGMLNSLSPLAILERGYSIVKREDKIIKNSRSLKEGDELTIQLHDGSVQSTVTNIFESSRKDI